MALVNASKILILIMLWQLNQFTFIKLHNEKRLTITIVNTKAYLYHLVTRIKIKIIRFLIKINKLTLNNMKVVNVC